MRFVLNSYIIVISYRFLCLPHGSAPSFPCKNEAKERGGHCQGFWLIPSIGSH